LIRPEHEPEEARSTAAHCELAVTPAFRDTGARSTGPEFRLAWLAVRSAVDPGFPDVPPRFDQQLQSQNRNPKAVSPRGLRPLSGEVLLTMLMTIVMTIA